MEYLLPLQLRGPIKFFVNGTARNDNHQNQITNINYDQNSMSVFKKDDNNKIKLASDKT